MGINATTSDKKTITLLDNLINYTDMNNIIVVKLKENYSSSFRWHFNMCNNKLIKFIGKEIIDLESHPNIFGKKKLVIWRFVPLNKGIARISFYYHRVWEGKESSIEQIDYFINIL